MKELLLKPFRKIGDICGLIVSTPQWWLIVSLQLISGFLSFAGLPLLVPVLNYISGGTISPSGKGIGLIEKWLSFAGIEPGFYSVLTIAALLILGGQVLIFASTLIAANAQVKLSEKYRKDIFDSFGKASWLWLLDAKSGEVSAAVLKEADIAGVAHLNAQRVVIYLIQVMVRD